MLFELLIQKKLNNILDDWITCKFRHHTWVSNLNSTCNKSGEYHLCIDFMNLNRSQNKNNYPMPSSEPMLHAISEVVVSSSLEGILEYHQVPVAEPG